MGTYTFKIESNIKEGEALVKELKSNIKAVKASIKKLKDFELNIQYEKNKVEIENRTINITFDKVHLNKLETKKDVQDAIDKLANIIRGFSDDSPETKLD